jgi:hypothetical protein
MRANGASIIEPAPVSLIAALRDAVQEPIAALTAKTSPLGGWDRGLGDRAIGAAHGWETMATLPGWPWDGYFAATNPGLFSPEHVIHSR